MAASTARVLQSSEEKCILCIGLVCVDLIAKCDGYPEEDTDRRWGKILFIFIYIYIYIYICIKLHKLYEITDFM